MYMNCLFYPLFLFKTAHVSGRILGVKLGLYHGWQCPGSLHHQGINGHSIDCVTLAGRSLQQGISTTCNISILRNYAIRCKCIIIILFMKYQHIKGLISWFKTNHKIPQYTWPESHNPSFCNRNVHNSVTNGVLWDICLMHCAHVCTFLLQNGVLWGICLMHCVIFEMGLFKALVPWLMYRVEYLSPKYWIHLQIACGQAIHSCLCWIDMMPQSNYSTSIK